MCAHLVVLQGVVCLLCMHMWVASGACMGRWRARCACTARDNLGHHCLVLLSMHFAYLVPRGGMECMDIHDLHGMPTLGNAKPVICVHLHLHFAQRCWGEVGLNV
jgi:hypothetical protein